MPRLCAAAAFPLALCLGLLPVLQVNAWGADVFTPPGANLALRQPYTLEPAPNYVDCTDDATRTVLTDGEYTTGYFWVQKSTVGWLNTQPVAIRIDLGQVEPIAGISFSTAAGVAGVVWPGSLQIMVSDDGQQWTAAGDLVTLSNRHGGAPAPTPYSLHRYVTGELQTRGRYVVLVVDQVPYAVVDEIEVYRGQPAWLAVAPTGRQTTQAPLEYWRARQIVDLIQGRLRTDLDEICAGIGTARLSEAERAALQARAAGLRGEIEALEDVPAEVITTVLPLNDLHARVYALQAPLLRARGLAALTVWAAYRYDMLQPLQAPASPPARPAGLNVRLLRNEHRAEVLNLTNATAAAITTAVAAGGAGRPADYLSLREVIYTDTRQRTPVAAALAPAVPAEQGLQATVPAGTTRQVWLDFSSRDLPAGDYTATLTISAPGGEPITVPISLHVASLTMPAQFSIAIGGWDETNNRGGYDVTAENMLPLIRNLREHGVNMPWSNPQVMPTPGEYDAAGNLTVPPDFTAWDEWVGRWQGAQYWGLFPSVKETFAKEPMGTPRFERMVGAWVTAWVQHAQTQGIKPSQIMVLLVDEPSRPEQDQVIIAWAKAIHAAQPEIVIWNDPVHAAPETALPDFYTTSNILSPNTYRFLSGGQRYQDFFVAQQQAGRELWFYSCSGPAKLLDPASYWRGQFWLNLKYGGKGSCYWAFGDEAGNSWNAYAQPRASFSPLFLSKTTVTDAKQMEAIREGAQDFETFVLLRARVTELERQGVQSPLVAAARALLTAGPAAAVAIMGAENQQWVVAKDREVMDRVRLQALDLLERLSEP